ncbi:hypothetical protein [Neobacillus mesonae]|uniref:hypothetical protein n=1 Tax=Neobacillus mesonae TaxID=1193713 RepID=UPI001FD24EC0|nr:hypothetical protein [Neobacillus mesonae]
MLKNAIESLSDDKVIELYGCLLDVLRKRKIIRTNNLVGEIGERKALDYYNKCPSLPNLQTVSVGAKNVDAINNNNERYSIKATTTKGTSVFNGLNDKGSKLPQEQLFEYVVIVVLNKDLSLKAMYELNWGNFLSLKKWNNSKRTWYLTVTEELKSRAETLYEMVRA